MLFFPPPHPREVTGYQGGAGGEAAPRIHGRGGGSGGRRASVSTSVGISAPSASSLVGRLSSGRLPPPIIDRPSITRADGPSAFAQRAARRSTAPRGRAIIGQAGLCS